MTVKLRRVIIAARFHSPCPEQATPQEARISQPGPLRDMINKRRNTKPPGRF